MSATETDTNGPAEERTPSATRIAGHVRALCSLGPDRFPGSDANREAAAYVAGALRRAGCVVDEHRFDVPQWRAGTAEVIAGDFAVPALPGPFSAGIDAVGPLVCVETAEKLAGVDATGAVLLLHGEIASAQLTPRGYPWYQNPEDTAVLEAIEALEPVAVVSATGKDAMTGGRSPFPLIEDVTFRIPSAYHGEADGAALAAHAGEPVRVRIDSETRASYGTQPIGRMPGAQAGRVVVAAHFDTTHGTPGALDNAGGVAVLLAVAEALAGSRTAREIEFVPFNGEDHTTSPGEVAYLAARPDVSDIALMVNIDGAGLPGGPTACSLYGVGEEMAGRIRDVMARFGSVAEGAQWPASDHMVFALRGVPALALTSTDFATASGVISHTPADTPDVVDAELLAEAARFIVALLAEV